MISTVLKTSQKWIKFFSSFRQNKYLAWLSIQPSSIIPFLKVFLIVLISLELPSLSVVSSLSTSNSSTNIIFDYKKRSLESSVRLTFDSFDFSEKKKKIPFSINATTFKLLTVKLIIYPCSKQYLGWGSPREHNLSWPTQLLLSNTF